VAGKVKVHACLMCAVIAQPAGGKGAEPSPQREPEKPLSDEAKKARDEAMLAALEKMPPGLEYERACQEAGEILKLPVTTVKKLVNERRTKNMTPAPKLLSPEELAKREADLAVSAGALIREPDILTSSGRRSSSSGRRS
jgi:hypothetical protein